MKPITIVRCNQKRIVYRINAVQLASRLLGGAQLLCHLDASPRIMNHRPSWPRKIRKIRRALARRHDRLLPSVKRVYVRVCVCAHNRTSEKFFHRSGENCVGIVNGRHGRTGPISHAGRTHPENSNENRWQEKEGGRVLLRLPSPRPLPNPEIYVENVLSLANKVGNVVTIFSSRELIKLSSGLMGKVEFPRKISP